MSVGIPFAANTSAATSANPGDRKRASYPTRTPRSPMSFSITWSAIACMTSLTLAKVKASHITALHPSVPNLISLANSSPSSFLLQHSSLSTPEDSIRTSGDATIAQVYVRCFCVSVKSVLYPVPCKDPSLVRVLYHLHLGHEVSHFNEGSRHVAACENQLHANGTPGHQRHGIIDAYETEVDCIGDFI
jgi:hypothetical protein